MDSTTGQKQQRAAGTNLGHTIPAYVLDDLSSRFIINSRPEEINTSTRLFFLIESAYWFYLDFHRVENPKLRDCPMGEFAYCLINHCPLLNQYVPDFDKHYESWKQYKRSITTCGAIMLNQDLKYVLLVQSYSSKNSWGFPKGKVNQGESAAQCAIREVMEETGFDITTYLRADEFLEREYQDQKTILFIVPGVSIDNNFVPKTRREIRDIQWFPVDSLPSYKGDQTLKEAVGQNLNLYTVMPYIRLLKNWIYNHHQTGSSKGKGRQKQQKQSVQFPHGASQDGQQPVKGKASGQQKPGAVRYSKDIIESQDKTVKQGRRGMTVLQSLFGNKNVQPQPVIDFKVPEIDTNFFYSEAWHNFSLDTDAMLKLLPHEGSYYLPKSYSHQRDLIGAK